MRYGLINSSGNVLEWFEDEEDARSALAQVIRESPAAAAHLDMCAFDETGNPIGEPLSVTAPDLVRVLTILGSYDPASRNAGSQVLSKVESDDFAEHGCNVSDAPVLTTTA